MSKLVAWDLEIKTPVQNCSDGWEGARRGDCGVSALVIWDSETGRPHIYDESTLEEAMDHLNGADLVVGYNTIGFDNEVMFGLTGRYITAPQYDVLYKIWEALPVRTKGWKLDDVANRTIGEGKNNKGEYATALWADGRYGELFDYCLNDVQILRRLFNHIVDTGMVIGPDDSKLDLEPPIILEYI